MKKLYWIFLGFFSFYALLPPAGYALEHPALFKDRIKQLSIPGDQDWPGIKSFCDDNLSTVIDPGYAGWGWRGAAEDYGLCFQVGKTLGLPNTNLYKSKALGMMNTLSADDGYAFSNQGSLNNYFTFQSIGLGNGSTLSFALPKTPRGAIRVMLASVQVLSFTYAGTYNSLPFFSPILRIGDTPTSADYSPADYYLYVRDPMNYLNVYTLRWLTSHHPAIGAAFYVTCGTGDVTPLDPSQYTLSGNVLTLNIPPTSNQSVWVQGIFDDYSQTVSGMGGLSAAQHDGPGYSMRTMNVGLAEVYDLLFNETELTPALRAQYYTLLNQEVDWYTKWGYEHNSDVGLGNYYIEGYLNGGFCSGYGTDGDNPESTAIEALAAKLIATSHNSLDTYIPGAYGMQGQYAVNTWIDILHIFANYKQVTGTDLLSSLQWTSHIVPAIIHATKPDLQTYYDGGDWTNPATAASFIPTVQAFLQLFPDDPTAPYARQWLKDTGQTPPSGPIKDYKTDYAPAYFALGSGPVYARSDWSANAVWTSLQSGQLFADHQHEDQGHITIQRGGDYLLVNAGEYGYYHTPPLAQHCFI